MSENSTPPMEPLSVGNVVSAGLRIYRDHFMSYFRISLRATLWSFLPIVFALLCIPLVFLSGDYTILFVLILILIVPVLFIYCAAKYFVNSALISRLVFGVLTNQLETVSSARQMVNPQMWNIWKALFAVGIILFVFNLILTLAQQLIFSLLAYILASLNLELMLPLISLLLSVVVLGLYIWLYSRLFIPEVSLAVETNINTSQGISRSWELTKGSVFRIQLIVFITFLVTIPMYIVATIPILASFASIVFTAANSPAAALQQFAPIILITLILFFVATVAITPFWQVIKGVIYYDLRSRREGMGLELRKREII
ncbi:hypothetical protein [Okeania sp. KiyG1]|uniref:hypothetical protein n=1 Tax=Okeania sp. KiyG1 TaxID=2720165 RepID=UPI0019233212|nr:hypothetical protein [Okeania sp. KiyG1]GFZ94059.1 hypothetical protein CYANOKiyG1_04710 [Okeania sp. KiyG1]